MNAREFRDLITHMEWADAQCWRAVRDLPQAQSDERSKYLFHHIHLVQWVYLQAWRGDPFVVTELSSYPDLAAVESWARAYYPGAADFAQRVDEAKFDQPVADKFGTVRPATLGESAWQVLSHTTYHRGQIATRIREIGGEPPVMDFWCGYGAGSRRPCGDTDRAWG